MTQRRQCHPTPVLLPGESHGWRSLVGCSPWGRGESDTTEWLHFHILLSCIGEGNGNPLQYSCLENPRDGGAWWAAAHGVTQSRTRLKRLSSSSSIMTAIYWNTECLCCDRNTVVVMLSFQVASQQWQVSLRLLCTLNYWGKGWVKAYSLVICIGWGGDALHP